MGKPQAQIEITASSSKLAADLNAARVRFQSFAGSVARSMGRAMSSGTGKLGATGSRALGNFGGDMLTRGLDAFVEAGNEVRNFERDLTRLGITAKMTPERVKSLRDSIRQTSLATAVGSGELMKAAGVYFDLTSDVDGMAESLAAFARIAVASGSEMEDVVRAASALKANFAIDPSELESTFSGLIAQAAAGTVGMNNLGKELVSLSPRFAKFGVMHGRRSVMELGAAFQIVAKDTGTASEAATRLEALFGMLQARQAQLKKAGVNVFETKGGVSRMRNLKVLIDEISKSKLLKDQRNWGKIFGEEKEGRGALESLLRYGAAYETVLAAAEDTQAVQQQSTQMLESNAGRIDIAMNKLKETVAAAFTPERIAAFASAMEDLADKVAPLVDFLGKAGNVLGRVVGAGRSIRGLIMGDEQTGAFGSDRDDEKNRRIAGSVFASPIARDRARAAMANRAGYIEARNEIIGQTANDRTTKESDRAAVIAAMSGQRGGANMRNIISTKTYGRAAAGEDYIRAAKLSDEDVDKIYAQAFGEALAKAGIPKIIDAIREGLAGSKPPTVQVGDNQVARSTKKATDARRR